MTEIRPLLALLAVLFVLAGCGETSDSTAAGDEEGLEHPEGMERAVEPDPAPVAAAEVPERFPNRKAFFGDLHVHTSWSTDSYNLGNRVGPEDAYRFARGEPVALMNGVTTQLPAPLDFVALTDHAEGFAVLGMCLNPDHPEYDSSVCEVRRNPPPANESYFRMVLAQSGKRPRTRDAELCTDVAACEAAERVSWQNVQAVANEYNDPGRFTALIGYEYSAMLPSAGMLHRNVIFRGEDVTPYAVSALHTATHRDFFDQLDAGCQGDCRVLTIPHNTNYSWGVMFARDDEDGTAYSDEDLARRARIERLAEVTQAKGSSECQLGIGGTDEACGFEPIFEPCGPGETTRCVTEASFVRNALLDGIAMAEAGRPNPFKLGMIGSTDTHLSNPGDTDAANYSRVARSRGNAEATRQIFQNVHPIAGPIRRFSEGGLAAVWAESNTREGIFDALERREAFATSGSRLKIRFFAGNLPDDLADRDDPVAAAYASGVPMGADLPTGAPPRFWVWAARDPLGPTLDRIQVIKGWIEKGTQMHQVRDLVCSEGRVPGEDGRCPRPAADVDTATCERRDGSGAVELSRVFEDPGFDPSQRAFYYVRVLENPTCRWTTWFANAAGIEPPADVPATVQNRGWSSPIWTVRN